MAPAPATPIRSLSFIRPRAPRRSGETILSERPMHAAWLRKKRTPQNAGFADHALLGKSSRHAFLYVQFSRGNGDVGALCFGGAVSPLLLGCKYRFGWWRGRDCRGRC